MLITLSKSTRSCHYLAIESNLINLINSRYWRSLLSKLLKQQIAKIQDEALKKKLNAKKGLTQAKALQRIKAWRNVRVALRLILSILTIGLVPFFYFLWAKKNNVHNNYVTIPIQKTQEAIDGIKKLSNMSSENNDNAAEQSVELSANDSESDKNHQQSSGSSELAVPQDDKSKSRTQVSVNKKQVKPTQETEHSSASSLEFQPSEESGFQNKTEVDINKTQPKQVVAIRRFKPETILLEAPGTVSHLQVPPQVQHNGLVSFKCSNGKDTYYAANEMLRDNIKILSSCPIEGGIVAYYSTNNSVTHLELHNDCITYRSYKKIDWTTAKFTVNPHFFIPLFIKMNSTGDLVEAVSIYDHKKNAIALNHYRNGLSETEEITFFEKATAATISCATVNKNLIFVGCSNGTIYRVEMSDDFKVTSVDSISFTDQNILSIAINYSGKALVILLSDGSVHHYENDDHRVLDIQIPSPGLTSLGFRNEDLLIATPNNVLVAKNVGAKPAYLKQVAENAKYTPVRYSIDNLKKQISIGTEVIAIFLTNDLHDSKPYKICKIDQEKNAQYLLFEKGISFSYDFVEPFITSSGHLAFYCLNHLTNQIEFYNQAGELLGSVPKFKVKVGANIVIENFNVEPGIGSKLLMAGSFTVTEEGKTTRYTFTESGCAKETVPTPAVAYSKILSAPTRSKKTLAHSVKSTPAVKTTADPISVNTTEHKPGEIGAGVRDYNFVWTATTENAEHLACKRIEYPDGAIQFEIGLWPEKFDAVGKLPIHTLILTNDENVKNWTPILSEEKQWNFFSRAHDSIRIYGQAGQLLLQTEIKNMDVQFIPAGVSTNKDGLTKLMLLQIHDSNIVQLWELTSRSQKLTFESEVPEVTTAFYDAKHHHLYIATKSHVLYQLNINTREQKYIALTDLYGEIAKMPISKIVLNEDRNLICLRFDMQKLRTYSVDFNNSEAKTVGWSYIDNAEIFDMQFTDDDVLLRFATTIGYHEAVNTFPKNRVSKI